MALPRNDYEEESSVCTWRVSKMKATLQELAHLAEEGTCIGA
jgi:hypothetical protein